MKTIELTTAEDLLNEAVTEGARFFVAEVGEGIQIREWETKTIKSLIKFALYKRYLSMADFCEMADLDPEVRAEFHVLLSEEDYNGISYVINIHPKYIANGLLIAVQYR